MPPYHFTTFWKIKMVITQIQPRFIRQKDAPNFFGVSRVFFDKYIRPFLREIWWGETAQAGISYDRLEMDAQADKIVERNGRPATKGENIWDVKIENEGCTSSKDPTQKSGMFKAQSSVSASEKVLERIAEMRQK